MNKIYITTIDLDKDSGKIKMINKILKCKNIINVQIERSCSKRGWHFILFCKNDCLDCRRKFDDATRFIADMTNRKPHQRDVLFYKKEKVYPRLGKRIVQLKDGYKDLDGEKSGTYKIPKIITPQIKCICGGNLKVHTDAANMKMSICDKCKEREFWIPQKGKYPANVIDYYCKACSDLGSPNLPFCEKCRYNYKVKP